MGWDGIPGISKDQLVAHLIEQYGLRHHERCDDILWAIYDTEIDGLQIVCFLLDEFDGSAWFKQIPEEWEPGYYSCPLRFLNRVPIRSRSWRQKVRDFHRRQ